MFIENIESDIQDIPFPSITICSSNQMRKSVWERYKNTNSSYWKNLQQYQSVFCDSHLYSTDQGGHSMDYFEYETFKNLMSSCAVSGSEIFQSEVIWQNTTVDNFSQYIQPEIGVLGLCYSLNKVPVYDLLNKNIYKRFLNFFSKNFTYGSFGKTLWNLDDGYARYSSTNVLIDTVPIRTSGVSYYHRLRLILHTLESEFVVCPNNQLADGYFFITLSNPADYQSLDTRSFIVPDTYTKIQITPIVKKMNSGLQWRSLEVRKCYLQNERKLYLFRLYTESNCINECIINETISSCGCVNIEATLPITEKVCGPTKIDCTKKALKATEDPDLLIKCNCLPTCSTIEYDIAATSNYYNWDYFQTTNLVKNTSRGAIVEFAFKNPYFTAFETASIFNLDSLISTIGGTLSLFLGLSLISIFEALYVIIEMLGYRVVHVFNE